MKTIAKTALAAALTLAAGGVWADSSQLAASAGLSPEEAAGMSLTEIARAAHNASVAPDERVAVAVIPGAGGARARSQLAAAAGLTPAEAAGVPLTALAIGKRNAETNRDGQVTVVSARSYGAPSPTARAQLIASLGLSPEAARGMTLTELYVAKINAETARDDRVGHY